MRDCSSRFDPVSGSQQSKIGITHHNTQISELLDKADMHRAIVTGNTQKGAIFGTFDVLFVQDIGFAPKNFVDSNCFVHVHRQAGCCENVQKLANMGQGSLHIINSIAKTV
jgi:hypothetical protein